MPGAVLSIRRQVITGWALHPKLPDYAVTLNVFVNAVLVKSIVVPPSNRADMDKRTISGHFSVELPSKVDLASTTRHVSLIIGETDEYLQKRTSTELEDVSRNVLVEDILGLPPARPWVRGLTYKDALSAGIAEDEVLELLYRDILGRPADESGRADYLNWLKEGSATFDSIRATFLASDEFSARHLNPSNAPGATFSRPLVFLSYPEIDLSKVRITTSPSSE